MNYHAINRIWQSVTLFWRRIAVRQSGLSPVLAVALAAVITLVGASACAPQREASEANSTAITSGDTTARFREEATKAGYVVQEGVPVEIGRAHV